MQPYVAPLKDMWFVASELADLAQVTALPQFAEVDADLARAVLEEAARFTAAVLAPLNASADREPGRFEAGTVTTAAGFRQAFRQFAAGGWQGLPHPRAYGGQQLPKLLATACSEMLNAANLSFALCPLLTDGTIEALLTAGSLELIQTYVPSLVEGRWTGTMNLTEPQAGSDLAQVRTRAEVQPDGTYLLFGTKIYITYGEHDLAENIIHMVLARTPGAPAGVKGLSLFVVPKFVLDDAGAVGARNDVHCLSIEHKLGIRASPTAVLQYGEHGGAKGYLVGEENQGLRTMFIMMNAARFAVGVQGIGLADRAYQQAVAYARTRVQSRPVDGSAAQPVPIIRHPDVRRLLGTMRALTEGARALAYVAAAHADLAYGIPDSRTVRDAGDAVNAQSARTAGDGQHAGNTMQGTRHQQIYEFLVPIVKGWITEIAVEVASMGIQVHGGMGFIEETGAAQFYRDARILSIYEGTTAIQANDLVSRKTLRDGGATARILLDAVARTVSDLEHSGHADARALHARLAAGHEALRTVVAYVLAHHDSDPNMVFLGSVPYLKLAGMVLAGWQMARALLVAERKLADAPAEDPTFYQAKIATARFFGDHVLSQAPGLAVAITSAASDSGMLAFNDAAF